MKDISLHILDIAENSINANATKIEIEICKTENLLKIKIIDNGKGMSEDFLKNVADPFTTTRTTRKIGLGIPFFKMNAEMTGGKFLIESKLGRGTTVDADFVFDSVDRIPLGNVPETMVTLLSNNEDIDFVLNYQIESNVYRFDTNELDKELDGISRTNPEILYFIKEMLNDNIKNIDGGLIL